MRAGRCSWSAPLERHRTTRLRGPPHAAQAARCAECKPPSPPKKTQAVLLTDILPTAWHACEMGEVGAGDVVAIWGAGPGERALRLCGAGRRSGRAGGSGRGLGGFAPAGALRAEAGRSSPPGRAGLAPAPGPSTGLVELAAPQQHSQPAARLQNGGPAVGILAAHCAQHRGARRVILVLRLWWGGLQGLCLRGGQPSCCCRCRTCDGPQGKPPARTPPHATSHHPTRPRQIDREQYRLDFAAARLPGLETINATKGKGTVHAL